MSFNKTFGNMQGSTTGGTTGGLLQGAQTGQGGMNLLNKPGGSGTGLGGMTGGLGTNTGGMTGNTGLLGNKTGGMTGNTFGTNPGGMTGTTFGTNTGGMTGNTGLLGNKPGGMTGTTFGTNTGGMTGTTFGTNTGGMTGTTFGTNTGGMTGNIGGIGMNTGGMTGISGIGSNTGLTGTGGLSTNTGATTGNAGITGTTNNFFNKLSNTTPTTSNLPFATKPTTSISQPTTGNIFNTYGTGNQPSNIGVNQNKKEMDKWEIVNVIQNYLNSISPQSNINLFKSMLYNRVPKGYENMIHNFQNYPQQKIKGEDGQEISIDYNLWVKSLQTNPAPQIYYPYQISSTSQLVARTKTTEVLELTALETIISLQNNLNQLNNLYDNEIELEISGIKKKMQTIKQKQLNVISKMDKLALMTGKAEKNLQMENILNTRLNNLRNVLIENNEYTSKIKELATINNLIGSEVIASEDVDYFKEFDNNRLDKNVNILREMKKIFDVTFTSLKENFGVVNFIRNDLENLKKYGKIPK